MGDNTLLKLSAFNIRKSCTKLFNAILVGKRNTGKSTVIQDILYYSMKNKIPRACVFSGTEEANGFFKQFIPGTFIFDGSNVESQLTSILDTQKDLTMKKQMGKISNDTDIRITIILDDLGYARSTLKKEIIRQIFMNGRHYGISMIVSCQYCMDISIDLRTNADFIYVLKQNNAASIKNLYENYFSGFEKKRHFQTVLEACTSDYQCLVLDNTRPTTNVQDVCFWYKAKLGRKFRFGSPDLWRFHNRWHLTDEERYLQTQNLKKMKNIGSTAKGGIVVRKEKKR